MAIDYVKALIDGTEYNLSLNSSSGLYEAEITAPTTTSYKNNDGHYYPVTIKASDKAGNVTQVTDADPTLGDVLKLRVKEKVAPVIMITSPTESEVTNNPKPTVNFTVTDSGSGVNPDTISVTVDSGAAIKSGITKTDIANGYQCTYKLESALTDGTHVIKVDASDYDDNSATQRVVSFVVDIAPPVLNVVSPVQNLITKNASLIVSGKTSDETAGIKTVTVKLNDGSPVEISVDASGNFSKTLTLVEGANTIVVTSTDAGGLQTSVTRVVTLDTQAPVISEITITPNPVMTGELISINVNVTD